jgi:hypothetical protein
MNLKNLILKTVKRRKQGIDFDQILNRESISEIEEIMKCNICFQVMINPYDCEICEQSFCYDCIMNLFENDKLCPGGCEEKKLKQSSSGIKVMLQGLNFKCINNECKDVIPYKDYMTHLKDCKYSNIICPNLGCNKQMKKQLLENHVNNECEFTVYKCENCEYDFKKDAFQEHLETCNQVYENLKKKYNLKGDENEDSIIIKSSKFMNTVILNLTKVLQSFDTRFDSLDQEMGNFKKSLIENKSNEGNFDQLMKEIVAIKKSVKENNSFEGKYDTIYQEINDLKRLMLENTKDDSKIQNLSRDVNEIKNNLKELTTLNNKNDMLIQEMNGLRNNLKNIQENTRFDTKLNSIVDEISSLKQEIKEKSVLKQSEISYNKQLVFNFCIEKSADIYIPVSPQINISKEFISPSKIDANNKKYKLDPQGLMNDKMSKELLEFETLENVFSNNNKKNSKNDKVIKREGNNSPKNNPSQKLKQFNANVLSSALDFNINSEKRSNNNNFNNDSLEFSIKENILNSLNEKIDKLYEMMQIILLSSSSSNNVNPSSNSIFNVNESIKPTQTTTNVTKKEPTTKNPSTIKSNIVSNQATHHHDRKDNKNIKKVDNRESFKQTSQNPLHTSTSISKHQNTSTSNLLTSRSKIIDGRKTVVSRERSPRICDHKTFSSSHNENSSNNEIVKLINKILEKMKNLENQFNLDELNNKLQSIGNQLKESITMAFLEIMKLNMNQNKNEEEQNENEIQINNNHNKISYDNNQIELLIELNKKIVEKLENMHKEKLNSYSSFVTSNEEILNNINSNNSNNYQNVLLGINEIKNKLNEMKKLKEQRIIEKEQKDNFNDNLNNYISDNQKLNEGIENIMKNQYENNSILKTLENNISNINEGNFLEKVSTSMKNIIENIFAGQFEFVWCENCKKMESKTTTKLCDFCGNLFCKDCGMICNKCNLISCEKCMICARCNESFCKKCRKICVSCSISKENPDSVCNMCLKVCNLCKGENCEDCLKSCLDCKTNFCVKCGKICKICSKTTCKKCETSHDYVICKCCKVDICTLCILTCINCSNQCCKSCIINCQKCKKQICKSCSTICTSCKGAFDLNCGKNNFQTKCFKCDKIFCNFCASSNTQKCKVCSNNFCKKCITNCSKCKSLVCANCVTKCDQCKSLNCAKCLEKCVCNKVSFCESCVFDVTPIAPHDCIKWLNESPTFSGLRSRSILPLPKNFELKLFIEKLTSDMNIGLTDNKNFEENSLVLLDSIWTLRVKTGEKYSTKGSLEEFLPHGAKEFDSIFISFSYGNLNFKINSEESLTAFSLDQSKDYYLYIENNDNKAGSKVSIIYIRKKI